MPPWGLRSGLVASRIHSQVGILTHESAHLLALVLLSPLEFVVALADRLGIGTMGLRRSGRGVALLEYSSHLSQQCGLTLLQRPDDCSIPRAAGSALPKLHPLRLLSCAGVAGLGLETSVRAAQLVQLMRCILELPAQRCNFERLGAPGFLLSAEVGLRHPQLCDQLDVGRRRRIAAARVLTRRVRQWWR